MRSSSFTFYQHHDAKFKLACERIELDDHFQPDITEAQLKQIKKADFFIMQPSNINAYSYGKIYQLKIVNKNIINDHVVILVSIDGEYSFHKKKHAQQSNFNSPLKFKIRDFLNPLTYWREILLADPENSLDRRDYDALILQLKHHSFASSHSNIQLNYFSHSANKSDSKLYSSHEADDANSESESELSLDHSNRM